MKKPYFLLIPFLIGAGGNPVPADIASSEPPIPTFQNVHEAFTRIVVNESGWRSRPDMLAILQILLKHGGGRDRSRRYQGSGHGIDYLRFLTYAAKVSLKTFPPEDPWAYPIMARRYNLSGEAAHRRHTERQRKSIGNSYWTSGLKADCSEPETWKEVYPDTPWLGFIDRCEELFAATEAALKKEQPNWCRTSNGDPATPKWWGGTMDFPDKKWEEVYCDEPGAQCKDFDWRKDPNNTSCARNRWYRPREADKRAYD